MTLKTGKVGARPRGGWARGAPIWAVAIALVLCSSLAAAAGVTPDSEEVKKLVNAGLGFLASHTDSRLGGKCLVGLAFIKAGQADHPRVAEAVKECELEMRANRPDDVLDVYSNGLAVIFLCELAPERHRTQIEWYLDRLKKRQKDHGGWGYANLPSGDTSQSQFGAFACWSANQKGFALDNGSIDRLADWLLRTQGPDGAWGYQGNVSTTDSPIAQNDPTCSLLAAGLGSMYICADLFGLHSASARTSPAEGSADTVPAALRRVDPRGPGVGGPKQYHPERANSAKVMTAIGRAQNWMTKNYTIEQYTKSYYYLYGLERYKSFQEAFESQRDESPPWYNDGFAYLASKQAQDGSWSGYCGAECDTSFAILFLLRSTQKSIQARLGEGMLLAGHGLPKNLARAKLRNGELIVEQVHTKVDQLLTMIDDGNDAFLDDVARDPSQLVVDHVDDKSARRLRQLVRGGEPEVRLLAVRALGRTGNLDYVPTLLYGLTDPDRRVVIEARNGLQFISRNFAGYGPPDEFTEQQRYEAADAWKKWYLSIRPSAILEQP